VLGTKFLGGAPNDEKKKARRFVQGKKKVRMKKTAWAAIWGGEGKNIKEISYICENPDALSWPRGEEEGEIAPPG